MKKNIFFYVISMLVLIGSILSCDNVNYSNHKEALAFLKIDNYMKYLSADLTDAKGLTISQISGSINSRAVSDGVSKNYLMKTDDITNINLKPVTFSKNNTIKEDVYDEEGNIIDFTTTITQKNISGQINKLYVYDDFIFVQFVPVETDYESLMGILKNVYSEKNGYSDVTIDGRIADIGYASNSFFVKGKKEGKEFCNIEQIDIRTEESVANTEYYNQSYKCSFDQTNFFTCSLAKSYIIDKKSGNLYEIPDFGTILELKTFYKSFIFQDAICINYYEDGVEYNYTFLLSIENQNLKFNRISISGNPYTDKYGNRFSLYSNLSGMDTENAVLHINRNSYYALTSDNRVVVYEWGNNMFAENIKIYKENLYLDKISVNDNFSFEAFGGSYVIKIINGLVYEGNYSVDSGNFANYSPDGNCLICKTYEQFYDYSYKTSDAEYFIFNRWNWVYDTYLMDNIPYTHIFVKKDMDAAEERNVKYVLKFYYAELEDILSDDFESKLKPILCNGVQYEKVIGNSPTSYDDQWFSKMDFSGVTVYKPNLTTDENGNLIPCVTLESEKNFEQVVAEVTVQPLN